MKLPQHYQRLDSRQLKIASQMLQFGFGIRDGGFAQFGDDQTVAFDSNFQSIHDLRETLQ